MKTKSKALIRQVFFILLTIIAFFFFAECLTRLGFLIYRYSVYRNVPNYPAYTFDAERGWKWKDQPLFRGRKNVPKEHPADVYRIITMGDSCTWGGGVKADQTFSAELEKILNEAGYNFKFEVLNAGIPGYNSRQIYLYLRNELIDYHPNLVVVRANAYDFKGADEAELAPPPPKNKASVIQLFQRILFKSRFYYLLKKELIRVRDGAQTKDASRYNTPTYLAKIRDLLSARGTYMIIVQPVSKGEHAFFMDYLNYKREWEAPLVRTYEAYIKSQHSPDELILDRVHPSALGHRIIAEEIYKVMIENGMIKTPEQMSNKARD